MNVSAADNDRTQWLAEEMTGLAYANLSPADVEQVKRLVLDHVGVACRGARLPWSRALIDWARALAAEGVCVIFGSPLRAAPSVAALVNATAAHGMELDDTHDESLSHPGAVVVATALAVGTAVEASGEEVTAATVAGYEAIARAGMAAGAAGIIEHGFHPPALFGGFGAATTAAKLYRLDARRLAQAWGLTLSTAGGSMQFSQDAQGTTVKRLHGGYGAHHGTMAAEFARLGMAGPARAFDGIYGLCSLFGRSPAPERLEPTPGAPFEIHRVSLKPYPCCRLFHSTTDALREVTEDFSTPDEAISEIRVSGPEILVSQHMLRRPESVMAAQYSLPYALGAALVYGPGRYAAYERAATPLMRKTRSMARASSRWPTAWRRSAAVRWRRRFPRISVVGSSWSRPMARAAVPRCWTAAVPRGARWRPAPLPT